MDRVFEMWEHSGSQSDGMWERLYEWMTSEWRGHVLAVLFTGGLWGVGLLIWWLRSRLLGLRYMLNMLFLSLVGFVLLLFFTWLVVIVLPAADWKTPTDRLYESVLATALVISAPVVLVWWTKRGAGRGLVAAMAPTAVVVAWAAEAIALGGHWFQVSTPGIRYAASDLFGVAALSGAGFWANVLIPWSAGTIFQVLIMAVIGSPRRVARRASKPLPKTPARTPQRSVSRGDPAIPARPTAPVGQMSAAYLAELDARGMERVLNLNAGGWVWRPKVRPGSAPEASYPRRSRPEVASEPLVAPPRPGRHAGSPEDALQKIVAKHGTIPRTFVLDGMNLAKNGQRTGADLERVERLAGILTNLGYSYRVFVDSPLYGVLTDKPEQQDRLNQHLDEGLWEQSPNGVEADSLILAWADRQGGYVISGDSFRDYNDQYPWVMTERHRLIRVADGPDGEPMFFAATQKQDQAAMKPPRRTEPEAGA